MALIEFRRVEKRFGPKVVFADLTLAIERGETLTVIGGSGQGKSVMLKLLIGLVEPDAGEIVFDGETVTGRGEKGFRDLRRRVGMLFQGAALFDSLSVLENVAYGLREHGRPSEREVREQVREALDRVGLAGIEAMRPGDLSGGMKKRVALARAIAIHPEVLLYDEPTTGLDPINVSRIHRLMQHLGRSLSVTSVVVTHDMQSAFAISDRIAMIHGGRVIFAGSPDEIRRSDDARVRAFMAGQAPEDEDTETLLTA